MFTFQFKTQMNKVTEFNNDDTHPLQNLLVTKMNKTNFLLIKLFKMMTFRVGESVTKFYVVKYCWINDDIFIGCGQIS